MQPETGEIRNVEIIPHEERDKWSEEFKVGDIVDFKGVRMKIIRIKQMRKIIILEFAGE